jgi:hypothetical protein
MLRVHKRNVIKFALAFLLVLTVFNLLVDKSNREPTDSTDRLKLSDALIKKSKQQEQQKIINHELNEKLNLNNNKNFFETFTKKDNSKFSSKDKYLNELSVQRINRYFDLLYDKEAQYEHVFKELNILLFKNLIEQKDDPALDGFRYERENFLKIDNGRVRVTDKFVEFLHQFSDSHSFDKPRNDIKDKQYVHKVCLVDKLF